EQRKPNEVAFDGLHITVGNVDQPVRSYSARWMLAGKAFPVDLADIVESVPLPKPDESWLSQVHKAEIEDDYWGGHPFRGAELFPPATSVAGEREDFGSPEEYREYLEEVREEVDERLLEVEAALHTKGP
ncbi:MAG: hypothetical protein ABSE73_20275, partial [Planctomycetota bacterium]